MLRPCFRFITMVTILILGSLYAGAQSPPPNAPIQELTGADKILDWLVLGPFPSPEKKMEDGQMRRIGYDMDYLEPLGGEAQARINRDTLFQTFSPMPLSANRAGVVRLKKDLLHNAETDEKVAYAFCYLKVEEEGNYTGFFGADDCGKVWVNGQLVHDQYVVGSALVPRANRFPMNLKVGLNAVLVKVDNNSGPWRFMLEIFDEANLERAENMQEDFTYFEFENQPEVAQWISDYLQYFFEKRVLNPEAPFEQEYLTVSDMWLHGGFGPRTEGMLIQDLHRRHLLEDIEILPDGYVHTHQHPSHSLDWGWPFPLWPQIYGGHIGVTYGWHFQNKPTPYGVWQHNMITTDSTYANLHATVGWDLKNLESQGIVENAWQLQVTGPDPVLTSPEKVLDAFNCPFVQIRWERKRPAPKSVLPYMEFRREGDAEFSPERRIYMQDREEQWEEATGFNHTVIPAFHHPLWDGKIVQLRFHLAPGESNETFRIDSVFTAYDTRHTINNAIFVLASWEYFRWTSDIAFLMGNANRMRKALLYQMHVMGGLENNFIRNPWVGHDGIPGWYVNEEGEKIFQHGHGIGNNYYDLLPFGGDDFYSTSQYYAALLRMARVEELIRQHPEWGMLDAALALDPAELRDHAADVKETANKKFWNSETDRFYGAIDKEGNKWDFGLTFSNLDSIWYDIASDRHAEKIMDWISGKRIVEGDTSTGEDIYFWEFGPRATTKRNLEWYGHVWVHPENIEFGGQIQDGGAVLGFAFFDLWARLQVYGPDDAWARFHKIFEWAQKVKAAGGYREYYASQGITMQGGGTAGGVGVDFEFLESSMIPAIIPYGFVGLNPQGDHLAIRPKLPVACPSMKIVDLLYNQSALDVNASNDRLVIHLKETPPNLPLRLKLEKGWKTELEAQNGIYVLSEPGEYVFQK